MPVKKNALKPVITAQQIRVFFPSMTAAGLEPSRGEQQAFMAIHRQMELISSTLLATLCARLKTYKSEEAMVSALPILKAKDVDGNDSPPEFFFRCQTCSGVHVHAVYYVRQLFVPVNNKIAKSIISNHPDEYRIDLMKSKDAAFEKVFAKWMNQAIPIEKLNQPDAEPDENNCFYPSDTILHEFHSCTRKRVYLTEAASDAAMAHFIEAGEEHMQSYVCVYCTGWHYGHQKLKRPKPSELKKSHRGQWRNNIHKYPEFLRIHGLDIRYVPMDKRDLMDKSWLS